MQHMWAPWRMEYVDSSEPVHGCPFCRAAREANDEEHYIVRRAERCFALLNLYPYNSGHLLIAPYEHVGRLIDLPLDTLVNVMTEAQHAMRVYEELMHPHGFNLGVNQGSAAGAGIPDHVHLHLVPRWNGDTSFMPVLADAKVMPEMLASTAARLRVALARTAPGE